LERNFSELAQAARPHLNALKNVPRALTPDVQALEELVGKKRELKSVAERRREFLTNIRREDQVYVPRFQQLCRVKKLNRAEEKLTVQLGALPVEISFDDVSFVTPPVSGP
jgi:hypothetical protein